MNDWIFDHSHDEFRLTELNFNQETPSFADPDIGEWGEWCEWRETRPFNDFNGGYTFD